jgi:hypothetical protein
VTGALRAALVLALTCVLCAGDLALPFSAISTATAAPRRARATRVLVDCFVDGAEVYIDGELVGTTPLKKPVRVSPGERVVRVVKRGYADFYETVKVPRSRKVFRIDAELLAVSGILRLKSAPEGARVTLEGVYLGDTPFDGDIAEGAQQLLLVLPGYRNHKLSVDVLAGEQYDLSVTLELLPRVDPFYTKWWFWTGVVAVTAGTVLAIVLATGDDTKPASKNPTIRLPLTSW